MMNNEKLYFMSFHITDCAVNMMMKIETFMQSNIKKKKKKKTKQTTLCCLTVKLMIMNNKK